jgi:hypothetical protein
MRDRRYIAYHRDGQSGKLQGTQGRFPSGTRAFDVNLDPTHALFFCFTHRVFRGHLCGKRRALS